MEDCEEGAGAWQRAESREQRAEGRLDGAEETLAQHKASLIIGVLDILRDKHAKQSVTDALSTISSVRKID